MHRRQSPIPRLWLMTDERLGESLWEAIARLPRGSGIVFRHYGLPLSERKRLFARVLAAARRRGLIVLRAGTTPLGTAEDGVHGTAPLLRPGIRTMSVHNRGEAVAAIRRGADAVFVSPLYSTRSHPGGRAMGRIRAGLLMRHLPMPVIALGGMNAARAHGLSALEIHGWAGIDAWSDDQKRNAVPI
ncbi:MAG: thiamine phosphate synthase [Sphingomonas sp.]|nr:thiamine phosphate synthase [Sphingomonas sp.]|tara:strand:- start:5252 stop:5812 length:561 start_codon:yes stop_codon:yes gene_type:complete